MEKDINVIYILTNIDMFCIFFIWTTNKRLKFLRHFVIQIAYIFFTFYRTAKSAPATC